jgi:hypothetical protein
VDGVHRQARTRRSRRSAGRSDLDGDAIVHCRPGPTRRWDHLGDLGNGLPV